jgi:hypothetical protein
MPTIYEIQKRNDELARRINAEALSNPQSPYAGKFVGIWNGQVVVTADTAEEVVRRLHEVASNPMETTFIEASYNYDEDNYIWCCR